MASQGNNKNQNINLNLKIFKIKINHKWIILIYLYLTDKNFDRRFKVSAFRKQYVNNAVSF